LNEELIRQLDQITNKEVT